MANDLLVTRSMRRLVSLLAITAIFAPTAAYAGRTPPPHPFGLGVAIGAPTDIVGKYYLGGKMAIDAGIGAGYEDNGNNYGDALDLHVDWLYHPVILTDQPKFTMPLYFGVGGRFLSWQYRYYNNMGFLVNSYNDQHLGVRAPIGVLMDFKEVNLDVFMELALVFDFIIFNNSNAFHDDRNVDVNLMLGARYYF
jgi:hypothetical protein